MTRKLYSEIFFRFQIVYSVLFLTAGVTLGADMYWTNSIGGDFTNNTLWMGGTAPGIGDNANFTNNTSLKIDWTINVTNASAFFDPTVNSTYTQAIGSSTWYITNQYVVGSGAANSGEVIHTSGTLVVTNGAGTGTMLIGEGGKGVYNLNGGTVLVNQLFVTNISNSDLIMQQGDLTLLGTSIISNSTPSFNIGTGGVGTVSFHINSGIVYMGNTNVIIGSQAGSTGVVSISGSGTIWSNQLVNIGKGNRANGNLLTVSNSAILIVGNEMIMGTGSSTNNSFLILSGGQVYMNGGQSFHIGSSTGSISNKVVVAGNGSILTNGSILNVGVNSSAYNELIISNGGLVINTSGTLGNGAKTNSVLVSGMGSTWSNTGSFVINGNDNFLMISNGGKIFSQNTSISSSAGASNNQAVVTGLDSLWKVTSMNVGTNSFSRGLSSSLLILDQGTLETTLLKAGENNSGGITNSGGIFQFTSANPSINSNSTDGIILTNGTISFRGITNAPIFITNQLSQITFQGDNTFMLNSSSNAVLDSYMFTNGLGSTNFLNLTLAHGTTGWRATNTTFGGGSTLLITNTTATLFGQFTNSGAIRITLSSATFLSNANLTGSGTLSIDNSSTVTFHTNSVYLSGAVSNAGTMNLVKSIATFQGQMDSPGAISMDANSQLTFSNLSGTTTIAGVISGAGSLQKYGAGTVILSGNNTFTGGITNGAGTLQLDSANALGSTTSIAQNGGTLLFNTGITNTSANVVLNGGIIQEVDKNISLGTLTVAANSSIQLTAGGSAGSFRFASATNTAGATLTIYGWSYDSANDKGSDDLIFFTNSSFETASFLNNVTFFGLGPGARILSTGELVPLTPEPGSVLVGWILSMIFGRRLLRNRKFLSR